MKKQNNNEENKCNTTQDFLPSDGASCSESSFVGDSWKSDPVKSKNANLAVEYVNNMRSKYAEAMEHPENSEERLRLFDEGKEYLEKLEALNQSVNS